MFDPSTETWTLGVATTNAEPAEDTERLCCCRSLPQIIIDPKVMIFGGAGLHDQHSGYHRDHRSGTISAEGELEVWPQHV